MAWMVFYLMTYIFFAFSFSLLLDDPDDTSPPKARRKKAERIEALKSQQ
jgi:hypothetical protein